MRAASYFILDLMWLAAVGAVAWFFPITTILIEVVSGAATLVLYKVERGWM